MQQLTISDITVTIVRKKIKNMYLGVCPTTGQVNISSPLKMPETAIKLFVTSKLSWIRKRKLIKRDYIPIEQRAFYRTQLKTKLPPLLEKWQNIIGVKINDCRIKHMKTRWGTCNINARRIWINLELAIKPDDCLEYIIVHEMVHLLEKSHNHRFKAYMDKFMPTWREHKKALNFPTDYTDQ